ncbi:lipocalin family protein [Pontibacter chinhatensis]|uniref:Lipocalin-like domain-containing protein n=1 Tax=Pontibacter chinhatensis TaxID=1436961 RepID=A0A1I2XIX8_9BACT|nr:lipocalin family protein [Pontibacter chinhatensis]SFH13362.1 Lipocalin-like domain-containing protein [Pontibacter chinhatensis]
MKTPLPFTRLLLLCLVAALPPVFYACDKDEEDTSPTAAELIKGSWKLNAVDISYYDAAGTLEHQERHEITGVTYFFKDDSVIVYSVPDNGRTSATYRLSHMEGKDYVSVTNGTWEYLIIKLTENELIWHGKHPSKSYLKDSDWRSASSATYTQEFSR